MTSTPAFPSTAAAGASAAADQTDRLILAMARDEAGWDEETQIVIVDDETGALTQEALLSARSGAQPGRPVLLWNASRSRSVAFAELHADALGSGSLRIGGIDGAPTDLGEMTAGAGGEGPVVVLMRLPKALAALDHRAAELARAAGAGAEKRALAIVAGGRVKHMTRTQNEVLERHFTDVYATRGLGKSRCLVATGPSTQSTGAAQEASSSQRKLAIRGQQRPLQLRGIGGVFGGASADAGSLLLLGALDEALVADAAAPAESGEREPEGLMAVDLGCGNGLMTAYLAQSFPGARILASDDDLDAVASARATLAANGLERSGIEVTWDDSISSAPSASADLVLLNPPFHEGAAIDATLVHGLLDAAARVLKPGGVLWFVHNSHLRYRHELATRIGLTEQAARDRRFTVLRAQKRAAGDAGPSAPAAHGETAPPTGRASGEASASDQSSASDERELTLGEQLDRARGN